MTRAERLERIATLAREAQREYFRTRDRDVLAWSQSLERRLIAGRSKTQ